MAITRDLGIVTAYGYALSKGYTGTEEEFAILMADYADVADIAEAWAVGTRAGVPVEESDETYHNNSKYYAEQAADSASAASDSAGLASGSAGAAKDSEDAAAASEAAAKDYADHIADPVSGLVTGWLNDHVDPDTGYVIDNTLTVQNAAADAKKVGDELTDVKSAIEDITTDIGVDELAYVRTGSGYINDNKEITYYAAIDGGNCMMLITDADVISSIAHIKATLGNNNFEYGIAFLDSYDEPLGYGEFAAVGLVASSVDVDVPTGTAKIYIYNRNSVVATPTITITYKNSIEDRLVELEENAETNTANLTTLIDDTTNFYNSLNWQKTTFSNEDNTLPYSVFRNLSRRIFTDEITGMITSFAFFAKVSTETAFNGTLEIWNEIDDVLYLKKSIPFIIPTAESEEIQRFEIDFPFYVNGNTYFSIRLTSDPAEDMGIVLRIDASKSYKYINNITDTEIAVTSISSATGNFFGIEYELNNGFSVTGPNIIVVDAKGYGDYKSIQEAIENCNDSPINPITIMVRPGKYEKFSMVQTGDTVNDITASANWPNTYPMRYISIVGQNRDQTIVQDDSGEYYTPPAEIMTRGTIANITFISTHDNPPVSPNRPYSYAVHLDFVPTGHPITSGSPSASYVSENVRFENCKFISAQNAAVGIGLHQDEIIEFVGCEFVSTTPTTGSYSSFLSYGAALVHNYLHANGITGQRIVFDNCLIHSESSSHATVLNFANDTGDTLEFELEFTARRTISVADEGNPISIAQEFSDSIGNTTFGNNWNVT